MAEGGSAWNVLSWLWEQRDAILQKLKEVYSWFRGTDAAEPRGILILGPGGTGKTTLGKLLSGEYNLLLDSPSRYDESISVERYSFKDAPDIEAVVPPGQHHRRDATWTDLLTDVAAGKFRGIILLAANGYHSIGDLSYKQHALYKGDKEDFLEAFIADRKAEELKVLRQLAQHVLLCKRKFWLLTLVTKQDLWWSKRSDVESHYRDGDWNAEIQQLLSRRDPRELRCELLFASLVISNFTTGKQELLKKTRKGTTRNSL